MRASGTGAPSPSTTRPRMATCRSGDPASAIRSTKRGPNPRRKKGPTVWDAVTPSAGGRALPVMRLVLERRLVATSQDEVEAVAERPLWLRRVPVERGDQPLACARVGHRIEDRIEGEER